MPCFFPTSNKRFKKDNRYGQNFDPRGEILVATENMPCYKSPRGRFTNATQKQQESRPKCGGNVQIAVDRIPNVVRTECDEFFRMRGFEPEPEKRYLQRKAQPPKKIVPVRKDPKTKQIILHPTEVGRLKTASKVSTLDERLDALMKRDAAAKRMEEQATRAESKYRAIDDARKAALEAKIVKDDLSVADDKKRLLERAFLAKQEDFEEVRQANRIINNARCHAILDEQIAERAKQRKAFREDELKTEKAIRDHAASEVKKQQAAELEKQTVSKTTYRDDITKQLRDQEDLRAIERKRAQEDAKIRQEAEEAIRRDREHQIKLEKERQARYREGLAKITESSLVFKKMLFEQEREAERRAQEYCEIRNKRQADIEQQERIKKEAIENRRALETSTAQKLLESKTRREELTLLRERERLERIYRQKELDASLRKAEIEHKLKSAYTEHIKQSRQHKALRLAQSEADFALVLKEMQRNEDKQRQLDEARELRRNCYRQDITRQICDKANERRRLAEAETEQANIWRESVRQHEANIQTIIAAKVNAMRQACLPDKCILDVEKQLNKINKLHGTRK